MNKPIIMALAVLGVFFSATAASVQVVEAQYGGQEATIGATPEQLARCEELDIPRSICYENNIIAKERLTMALENPSTGSGTSMLATQEGQTWAFIGVLGAIFGVIAALFFFKGRGHTPPS